MIKPHPSRFLWAAAMFVLLSGCGDQTEANSQGSGPAALNSQSQAVKLAVMATNDFIPDVATNAGKIGLPEPLAARIMERLTASKRFTVLERTALRRVINEQRFGQKPGTTDLDRVLDKAVNDMEKISGGTLLVSGALAIHNDVKKDFKDLGSALGADYIVYAKLESVKANSQSTALPYSSSGKRIEQNTVNARLYLRVINVAEGRVAGAASVNTQLSETLLQGMPARQLDQHDVYDAVSKDAFNKILDIIFPARIVSTEPFVINRGSNDSVYVGDTYSVEREGKDVTDETGIKLGRLRNQVGEVSIAQVQETLSVVELVSGEAKQQDLVLSLSTHDQAGPSRTGAELGSNKEGQKRQTGKATLIIGKIAVSAGGNTGLMHATSTDELTNDLMVKLTQTNRFDILERQQVDQVLDEKVFNALTQGEDISARLRTLTAADYLIHVSVNDLYVKHESNTIAALGETVTKHFVHGESTLRIVDVHTGKVIAADKVGLKRLLGKSLSKSEISNIALDKFSTSLVSEIVDQIYPIKVMAVTGDTLYLNRGLDGGLTSGDKYNVYRQGEALIDPDTGLQFGNAETKVATVSLLDVEQARSTAQIIKGSGIQKGDILKKIKAPSKPKKTVRKVKKPNF